MSWRDGAKRLGMSATILMIVFGAPRTNVAQPPAAQAKQIYRLPKEPKDVSVSDPEESLAEFSDFCWETFLALNMTAAASGRGTSDTTKGLAASGDDARTVWMTWRSIDDLFPADRQSPKPWQERQQPTGRGDYELINVAKFPVLGDVNQPGGDFKTFFGPVIAQNRTYARYEIRFNQHAYEHILDKKLWNWQYLPAQGTPADEFVPGSIAIKAAWRVISDDDPDLQAREKAFKDRCFWRVSELMDPVNPSQGKRSTVGLVGLHVVVRTPKRKQWIWASFEQRDNVPSGSAPEPGKHYSFNYGDAYRPGVDPDPNTDVDVPPDGKHLGAIPKEARPFEREGKTKPSQIVRVQDLPEAIKASNLAYQAKVAGTVWENYDLVVTQYPTQPDADDENLAGVPFPGPGGTVGSEKDSPRVSMANTTMETYLQKNNSCMECHQQARTYGVSFVFSLGRALSKKPVVRGDLDAPVQKPTQHDREITNRDHDVLRELFRRATPSRSLADADAPEIDPEYEKIFGIFDQLISQWENVHSCAPDLVQRHGSKFGWVDASPWPSWDALKAATFNISGTGPGDYLITRDVKTAEEVLLIRVLSGPGEPIARGQRMPLGGPYLSDDDLAQVKAYIQSKLPIPATAP